MYRVSVTAGFTVPVDSLKEASRAVREHIEAYDLGHSEWTGTGDVFNSAGDVVARVSFNGRLWTPEPWPECREITEE